MYHKYLTFIHLHNISVSNHIIASKVIYLPFQFISIVPNSSHDNENRTLRLKSNLLRAKLSLRSEDQICDTGCTYLWASNHILNSLHFRPESSGVIVPFRSCRSILWSCPLNNSYSHKTYG